MNAYGVVFVCVNKRIKKLSDIPQSVVKEKHTSHLQIYNKFRQINNEFSLIALLFAIFFVSLSQKIILVSDCFTVHVHPVVIDTLTSQVIQIKNKYYG